MEEGSVAVQATERPDIAERLVRAKEIFLAVSTLMAHPRKVADYSYIGQVQIIKAVVDKDGFSWEEVLLAARAKDADSWQEEVAAVSQQDTDGSENVLKFPFDFRVLGDRCPEIASMRVSSSCLREYPRDKRGRFVKRS